MGLPSAPINIRSLDTAWVWEPSGADNCVPDSLKVCKDAVAWVVIRVAIPIFRMRLNPTGVPKFQYLKAKVLVTWPAVSVKSVKMFVPSVPQVVVALLITPSATNLSGPKVVRNHFWVVIE